MLVCWGSGATRSEYRFCEFCLIDARIILIKMNVETYMHDLKKFKSTICFEYDHKCTNIRVHCVDLITYTRVFLICP